MSQVLQCGTAVGSVNYEIAVTVLFALEEADGQLP